MSALGHLDPARRLALGLGETPSALERAHLAACQTCSAEIQRDGALWAGLRALPQPSPPAALATSALARFRLRRERTSRTMAAAAILILAVEITLFLVLWRAAPTAIASLVLGLPRWLGLASLLPTLARPLVVVWPMLALASGLLLGAVVWMLRKLTSADSTQVVK